MFLPSVSELTTTHCLAPLVVLGDESVRSPIFAEGVAVVLEQVRLSSKILVVVRIRTLSFVVFFVEWTPLRLIIKHEKFCVLVHLVDQPNFQFLVTVRKRAVVFVLAFVQVLWEHCTILCLVLVWMVDAFYSIVREQTIVLVFAIAGLVEVAQVEGVKIDHF